MLVVLRKVGNEEAGGDTFPVGTIGTSGTEAVRLDLGVGSPEYVTERFGGGPDRASPAVARPSDTSAASAKCERVLRAGRAGKGPDGGA